MKHISVWALHNKWTARFLIIFGFSCMNSMALFWGNIISGEGFRIPLSIFILSVVLFCTTFLYYPSQTRKSEMKHFYLKQKITDVILISSTFFFVLFGGNRAENWTTTAHEATVLSEEKGKASFAEPSLHPEKKKNAAWKAFKKKLRSLIRQQRQAYKDLTKGERTALIILAFILLIGLLFGVAALACSLSCSGSEGAAILVAVFGGALVIFGFTRAMRALKRKKVQEAIPKDSPPD
jgi:hypothetical protein